MRIALFGGSGFVGRRALEELRNASLDVTEISRTPFSNKNFVADITQLDSLFAIQEKFDCVVICSSKLPQKEYAAQDLTAFVDVNVKGVNNILIWASQRNVRRIIYCSTLSFLSTPDPAKEGELMDLGSHYVYKITKAAAEHFVIGFCRERNIQYCALRIASVYGLEMKKDVIFGFCEKIKRHEKITIQNSNLTADLIHVNDVAKAIHACCLNQNEVHQIINVGSGKPIALTELVDLLARLLHAAKPQVEVKSTEPFATRKYSNKEFERMLPDRILLESGLTQLIASWQ